jgi:FG-GAP-like repeat
VKIDRGRATGAGFSRISWGEINFFQEVRVPNDVERPRFSPMRPVYRRASVSAARFLGRVVAVMGVTAFSLVPAASADTATQGDWSGGEVETGTVSLWDSSFAESTGISWLAVPGQITLSGVVLETAAIHVIDDNFVAPSSLDPVDMDGDGDLDLVGAAFDGSRIRWWRNDGGQPPAWTVVDIEMGFVGAASARGGDIDGDGTMDVAGCAWVKNEIAIWFNQGQGLNWTRQSVTTDFAQCHWVDLADLDGDGDLDLLGAAAEADTVAVWINDGAVPVGLTMQVIDDSFDGARSLVPADIDDDGDVDLFGTALEDDELSWWRNDGGEPIVWTRQIISDDLAGSHHANAWDMDLDGDLDILALGYGHPWLKVYWNDGGDPLVWRGEDIGDAIVTPLVLGAGDLDGDGDMDVAATSDAWNRVIWWQNNGEPPVDWSSASIASQFPGPWPLAVADLDGDGALDIAAGASGASTVAWWRLADFAVAGSITSRILSIPDDVVALECDIDATVPPETAVEVAIRYGAGPDSLGDWIPLETGQRLVLMERSPVFLQYRLELGTSSVTVAPTVRAIEFRWTGDLPTRSGSVSRLVP